MSFARRLAPLALALVLAACGPARPLAPVAPPDAAAYQPGADPRIDALIARELADPPELALTTARSHYIVPNPGGDFIWHREQLAQFYDREAPGWVRMSSYGGGRIIYRADDGDPRLIVIRMSDLDAQRTLVTYAFRDKR